jgi:signal transduction histidine kinase
MKNSQMLPTQPEERCKDQENHENQERQPNAVCAPLPSNEMARLADLYASDLLESPFEERFDRITRLAIRILKIPISLISLVDVDRQWFKSRQGIATLETPRSSSFCAYAILKDSPLIIPDTHCDARFENNPLVTQEPFIRSYAGCPIKGPNGYPLGTLCVIDRIPRQFNEEDIQVLQDLAGIIEREIAHPGFSKERNFTSGVGKPDEYFMSFLRDFSGLSGSNHKEMGSRRSSARRYNENLAVFDASNEGLLLLSADGYILALNQRFTEFFSLTEEIVNWPLAEFMQEISQLFDEPASILELFNTEAPVQTLPRTLIQLLPGWREIEPDIAPVKMNGDMLLGWLYSFRDVTSEREIDRVRNRFISSVSHEIRTPLTSIQGYVDLLLARREIGPLNPMQLEFLTIVQKSTRQLTLVVRDLLDSARIQEGSIDLQCVPLDMCGLAKDVTLSLRPMIEEKQQQLITNLEEPLPIVKGDVNRIRQVLINLLSNANKYTPDRGKIELRIYREQDEVCIEVQDTGIGLTEEEQSMLFTRFFRARNALTNKAEGTGLGLAISRALVKEHGGVMKVFSKPGQGSTFAFTLPIWKDHALP